ncbi:MAG: diguanylate cyclase [Rhodospirillaceae bacterium]|nr:diguanylate cyclase [Rhodospirillales bacterium]
MDLAVVTQLFLLYFILPLWLLAGVADWLCHRASHIESTTGAKETVIHLLMLVEMGVPVLAGLLLEINALVLLGMLVAFLLHEATSIWDVSYAVSRRNVTPVEQHVHSYLEMLPLMGLSFLACLNWPQALAIFGFGPESADWGVRFKDDPLPAGYLIAMLGLIVLFEVLPYLEEFWRGWRANDGHLVPRSRP